MVSKQDNSLNEVLLMEIGIKVSIPDLRSVGMLLSKPVYSEIEVINSIEKGVIYLKGTKSDLKNVYYDIAGQINVLNFWVINK